ncbi:ABC transporter substrate-binding protein [Ralstonia sp. UBA689]|uniref:ABC transporter substrate-binding protein n=1 Tax=Ralstonia sp. UBA689 TaxID=1947373 RepID=UPI0025F8320A|nr:ABC transporter substrate-binding protein [Ralstonia sp. UBA689]
MPPILNSRRRWLCQAAALLAAGGTAALGAGEVRAQWLARTAPELPSYYPRDYDAMIDAARREGRVTVYSTTDFAAAHPLIRAFETRYPGITVDYREQNSDDLYRRFLAELASKSPGADVVWSSAMPEQFKLVNDGHALSYASPERPYLPSWAIWKNEAYGTSYEPVVFVYNARQLAADLVPATHADFARILNSHRDLLRGRVASYDIEHSGSAFLFAAEDARTTPVFWDVARALGGVNVNLYITTAAMLERVASGESLLAYNVIGSYAARYADRNPALAIKMPTDYTLVATRVAFIARRAARPNAARLWLDFMLSRDGQGVMADRAFLFSLRQDVETGLTAERLLAELGNTHRPIPVGPGLLAHQDQLRRADFLKRWHAALGR